MEGYTKDDVINRLNRDYLEKVALKTNNAPRGAFLSYGDEKFRDYAKGKFTTEELTVIWQNYVLSNPPKKVAKSISHRSAHDLIELYLSQNPADTYFVEHKVGDSFCDLVLVEGEDYRTSAVEIKSNGDDLRHAVNQCERYGEWADTVTVLVETEKRESASIQLPEWVGIKVIGDEGDVTTVRAAAGLDQSPTQLVDLMTVDQLKQLLRIIGERVSGRKNELRERVNAHINEIPEPTVRRTLVLG